jgi:ubiquinone/menaquinone biosynthesis C-methylase UbiE
MNMSVNQQSENFINVRELIKELSVEELCGTAEEFFARLGNWDYQLAKPFAAINETPELLVCFGQVVHGLNLLPDMTILDFGVGSCWTSRFLSQLGLEVIACDASASALKIGEELYRRQPLIGDKPAPKFLHFDGHRFDLPDASVDRVSCWDAFHHVPNQAEVLAEMARVLKPGGIAGFSEPGPNHSRSPQAQYEMRTNRVIENDINVKEIWETAQLAGFTEIKLAIFNPISFLISPNEFEDYLNGGTANALYADETRNQMQHRRVFFLFKGGQVAPADSRQRAGLMAELKVELTSNRVAVASHFLLKVQAKNSGENVWLPAGARTGAVHFGVHLFDENGVLLNLDYFVHHNLKANGVSAIQPGEIVEFETAVPAPAEQGQYILECDLVSQAVCWFQHNGAATVRFNVEVV